MSTPSHEIVNKSMKAGDYICIRGKYPYWLDKKKQKTFPDYNALIIDVHPKDNPFQYRVMKSDGTLWNIYEKHVIGEAR
jgi:hypothetical protein